MEVKLFFPTGILFHSVSSQLADEIESLVVPKLNNLNYVENVKSDFFEQNKIIEEKEIENLIKEVKKCVEYYSQAVKVEPKGLEYWVQDYSPNDFHEIHNHGRTLFSVVYWVRASQTPGDLIIYEASEFKKNWFLKPSKVPFGYTNISITPKKGNLVVFPGYLNHEVLPGGKNCIRTTIAFNIT